MQMHTIVQSKFSDSETGRESKVCPRAASLVGKGNPDTDEGESISKKKWLIKKLRILAVAEVNKSSR